MQSSPTKKRPLSSGETVVLKKGKGSKSKFNNNKATVVEYPNKGCWMTVKINYGSGNSSSTARTKRKNTVIKWRKEGYASYFFQLIESNEDLLANIFSFLGSTEEMDASCLVTEQPNQHNLMFVKDTAVVHTQLCAVSKEWKSVCNKKARFIFGRVNANFDALKIKHVIPCILFMCKYKLSIGSLIFTANVFDVPLIKQLLVTCETSKLTFIR